MLVEKKRMWRVGLSTPFDETFAFASNTVASNTFVP
jgi:hypothetical protein